MAIGKEVKPKLLVLAARRKSPAPWKWLRRVRCDAPRTAWPWASPTPSRIRAWSVISPAQSLSIRHQYLEQREVKRVGYIVVSPIVDSVVALTSTCLRRTQVMKEWSTKALRSNLCCWQQSVRASLVYWRNIVAAVKDIGDEPQCSRPDWWREGYARRLRRRAYR